MEVHKNDLLGWVEEFIHAQHDQMDEAMYLNRKEARLKAEGRLEMLYKIKNKLNNNNNM